ncbi:MAG: energy transducer TonB [Elusimicrobia bacterium]|nr:energy transducer TonB [Elusimicrobiota bacterium]
MRSYLIYSASAHFVLLAGLFLLSRNAFPHRKEQAYYIDFIGQDKVVTMAKAADKPGREAQAAKEPAAAAAAQPRPKAAEKPDEDDFASSPLPKPSVLSSGAKLFEAEKKRTAPAGEEGEEGTPLVTDADNFPYPWYIAQVREALWNAWTERMPSAGSLRCTVRFTIMRNGTKSIVVERSSGNRLFDSAAESSVQAASPFPPLPDGFTEDRLTVHVEFKAAD